MHELILNGVCVFVSKMCCSENAGLLALTKVGSRRVVQISAGFMIFFSILGKLFSFAKNLSTIQVVRHFSDFHIYINSI